MIFFAEAARWLFMLFCCRTYRVRGLKLLVINTIRICNLVASLADVWIKILKNQGMTFNAIVASFGVRGLKP